MLLAQLSHQTTQGSKFKVNRYRQSFGINDEVNLAARDPEFTQSLQQDFAKDLAHGRKVTYQEWKRRPVWARAPEQLGWVLERQQ